MEGTVTIPLAEYHRLLKIERLYKNEITFIDGSGNEYFGISAKAKIAYRMREKLYKLRKAEMKLSSIPNNILYALNSSKEHVFKKKKYYLKDEILKKFDKLI